MKRLLALLPFASVLLAGACDSAALPPRRNADAYEFRLQTQPPLVLRWPSGRTVRVYVAAGSSSVAAQLHDAFDFAAAEWNRHALFGEYRLAEAASLDDADVVLRWMEEVAPVSLAECSPAGVRAVTTFCGRSTEVSEGLLVFPRTDGGESRVQMVVSIVSSQAATAGRVRALVTHEMGHVLGIVRHSPEPRDLMYEGELSTATLSTRDRATLQLLYQTRPQVPL